jgi:type II secretory ATPase GspE/PulE/Tfp pilus assembly ATPase PilB-like protein
MSAASERLVATLSAVVPPPSRAALAGLDAADAWDAAAGALGCSAEELTAVVAQRYRLPSTVSVRPDGAMAALVPEALARRFDVVPVRATDAELTIATPVPCDPDAERALAFATRRTVRTVVAPPSAVANARDALYRTPRSLPPAQARWRAGVTQAGSGEGGQGAPKPAATPAPSRVPREPEPALAADGPVVRLVDRVVAEAVAVRASDIHLEAGEAGVSVRFRVDGVLRDGPPLPRDAGLPLVSRVKIMSGLDIADRLRPQDGRARVVVDGQAVDLRVSTLPAAHGEKVVIRILDARATVLALDALGLPDADAARLDAMLDAREGIVLVTGPTGSGKTTTLYAALRQVMRRGVNVVTVEDPVEYRIAGIVQVQVNERAGLTFAAALRSILRQDPDVVLVGEIRDRETATIAVQASLTGHLVLSTLHTIDAASAVTRLVDLGVEPFKIAAALRGVVAQRLVRRLCDGCRRPVPAGWTHARLRGLPPEGEACFAAAPATGDTVCAACGGGGYRGRAAVVELLGGDPEVARLIALGEPPARVAAAACAGGMRSLWESGAEQVRRGVTDVDELLRALELPPPPAVADARLRGLPRLDFELVDA